MTETSHHPDDDQLAQFAHGKLSGDAFDVMEAHLDGCATCRQLLAAVSNGSTPNVRPERPTLSTGDKLGRYEIERLIAAGGMGMLYVAKDPQLGRRVALKLMRPSMAAAEGGRVRLLREAQTMASLAHPNVVHVYELGETDGRVFVAMELVDGGTLRDWMKKPSSWKEVVAKFCAAGDGLAAAHRAGVVHRDFKPENVLVGSDGRPRVTDFGLARPELVAEEELPLNAPLPMRVTHTGTMLGTPAYMAPEQLAGKTADARSDQYAFSVALYEALAGKRPFPADTLEELRARVVGGMPPPPKDGLVPAHVWAAIARGLNPEPAQRFPDMEAMLTVLRFDIPAGFGKPPKYGRRTEMMVAAAVISIAGIVSGLALFTDMRVFGKKDVEAVAAPLAPAAPAAPAEPAAPESPEDAIDDEAAHADDEEEPPAVPQPGDQLTDTTLLEQGTQRVFRIPGIQRLAVGDAAICDVKTIGNDQVLLIGAGLGKTSLLVWTSDGKTHSSTVVVGKPTRGQLADGPGVRILEVGMQQVMNIPDITRVAIGDAAIADVKTIGNNQLLLIGTSPGKTTLLVWTKGGKRESFTIAVDPPTQRAKQGELELLVGERKTIAYEGLKRIAIGDAAIADVKTTGSDEVKLTGLKPGHTTLLIWTKSGDRHQYPVEVIGPKNQ